MNPRSAVGALEPARMTVIGTGYLGACHAAAMAELGHEVLGMDVDRHKIDALSGGTPPFYEPGLEAMLRSGLASGRLRFTASYQEAAQFADVHFVCVGTPSMQLSAATDLRFLDAAVSAMVPCLARDALIVGKSTVPVGTAARVRERCRELAEPGVAVDVAWSPEFVREGHALADTLRPDRLVFGVTGEAAEATLRRIHAPLLDAGVPVVTCDLPTAELVKVAANSFLATKISFMNAMAEMCEVSGADVTILAQALAHDPRIGGRFLRAGLGFGGGCLPKDLRAFSVRARELGVEELPRLLEEVDAINMGRRARVIRATTEMLGGSVLGRRVAVLGAAFKPGTDDVRDSPALNVAMTLQLQGAAVSVFDPRAGRPAERVFPTLAYADSAEEVLDGSDVTLHLTEWPEFAELDPARLIKCVREARLLDARNTLDLPRWASAGWTVRAIGRPSVTSRPVTRDGTGRAAPD